MEELALKIDHVYKEYRLGTIGGGTLKAELQSKFAKLRKKDDPNLKIGQVSHEKNERFLALKDISLEIKKGERIAIIGHNGAGKSTLLKLICRVTAPTKGDIYMNGRITSMLEVGTGFHDELTGKENIYLNGAILGMTKTEIDEIYDEIVEFSEIGQFIDTPVKRYSSGMKVKLGFSVASHLKSEIVIMDEVLAVGDVNFQNKCINQMKKLAEEEGRTILYVSHNMATVRNLCERCVVLSHGEKIFDGNIEKGIAIYSNKTNNKAVFYDVTDNVRNSKCSLRHKILTAEFVECDTNTFFYADRIHFRVKYENKTINERLLVKFIIMSSDDQAVGTVFGGELNSDNEINTVDCFLDTKYLVPGEYHLNITFYNEDENGNVENYDGVFALFFDITTSEENKHISHTRNVYGNTILPCIEIVDDSTL